MSDFLKKMIAVLFIFTFALSLPVFAESRYTVEMAYEECKTLHPDFVAKIKSQDPVVTDKQLITFISDIKDNLASYGSDLTRESFNSYLSDAVENASRKVRNLDVRDAISSAYPGSIKNAVNGIITDEFRPIYDTVKRIVFDYDMIGIAPKVTSLTASLKGGIVTARVSSANIANEKIVIALYDKDNTLLAVVAPDSSGTVVINAPTAYKVKAMCLYSFKSIYPSCEAIEVYL